jgi:hypothetical protein
MKNFLLFKINGEIEQKITKCKNFQDSSKEHNIDTSLNFSDYVKYENYIILHNRNLQNELNRTVFYFTEDRFNGDVALIKIGENNSIKNLLIGEYFKKLTRKLQEIQKNNSDSNSDINLDSDVDLSMYGKILIKEPFEYY